MNNRINNKNGKLFSGRVSSLNINSCLGCFTLSKYDPINKHFSACNHHLRSDTF